MGSERSVGVVGDEIGSRDNVMLRLREIPPNLPATLDEPPRLLKCKHQCLNPQSTSARFDTIGAHSVAQVAPTDQNPGTIDLNTHLKRP